MKPYQTEYKTTSTVIHHPLTGCSVSGCGQSFFKKKKEVNMDKSSSTVCILIAALCALVHFGTAFSKVKPKPDVLISEFLLSIVSF